MRMIMLASLLGGALSGCGATAGSTELPPAASAGDESTKAQSHSDAPLDARPVTGPATLTVIAKVAGQPASARVRVLDAQGAVSAEGRSGSAIALAAGSYQLEATIDDAAVMADTPTQRSELRVEPGQAANVEAVFPWAKVSFDVRAGGRSHRGANVVLLRDGKPVAEIKSGVEPVPVTPGRYEADVALSGRTIHVTGLQFADSATRTIPVNVQY